jgi:hypothetical protein
MKMILRGWNFPRVLRLILGFAVIVQGLLTKNISFVILGILFSLMAVLNVGCCAGNNCSVKTKPAGKINKRNSEEPDGKK